MRFTRIQFTIPNGAGVPRRQATWSRSTSLLTLTVRTLTISPQKAGSVCGGGMERRHIQTISHENLIAAVRELGLKMR
jgi:hypothetical protein